MPKGRNVPPKQQGEEFRVDWTNNEDHLDFIGSHWVELAATAYAGYLLEGRGILIIDGAHSERTGDPGVHAYFMGEQAIVIPTYHQSATARHVKRYDPETEIIVVVREPKGLLSSYRLHHPDDTPVTPREAYATRQSRTTPTA